MLKISLFLLAFLALSPASGLSENPDQGVSVDADSDCFYAPPSADTVRSPALLVLSCTGIVRHDIDSLAPVADSFGLILAGCHGSRNHRTYPDNDRDIIRTFEKLVVQYPVDPARVFICGFSGMGAQSIQEVLSHPALFRGALSACSPAVDLSQADPGTLAGSRLYLISREKDWNLEGNRQMSLALQEMGTPSLLQIYPGEHAPGPIEELYQGITWLLGLSQ